MNWFEFNGIFKICLRRNEWDIVWFQHLIMKNATEKEQHWLMTMNWSWWWRARAVNPSHVFGTRSQEAERSPTNQKGRRFDRCSLCFFLLTFACFITQKRVEWNVSMICLVWHKNMLFNLSDEQKNVILWTMTSYENPSGGSVMKQLVFLGVSVALLLQRWAAVHSPGLGHRGVSGAFVLLGDSQMDLALSLSEMKAASSSLITGWLV